MGQVEHDEDLRLPPPPTEPDLDECCGSGCEPCIFDLYESRLERWHQRCEAIRQRHESERRR